MDMTYKINVMGVLRDATPEEVALFGEMYSPEAEATRLAEMARIQRDALLSETDWMALSDRSMSPEWASYRQALRDITTQAGFPEEIVWPTKPE